MAEPLLVLTLGMLIAQFTEPLGIYLVLTAISLFLSANMSAAYDHVRVVDMHDSLIEQQQLAERFRAMRGDR